MSYDFQSRRETSHTYKELVRTLQLNVDVSNDTTTLHIDTIGQADMTILRGYVNI